MSRFSSARLPPGPTNLWNSHPIPFPPLLDDALFLHFTSLPLHANEMRRPSSSSFPRPWSVIGAAVVRGCWSCYTKSNTKDPPRRLPQKQLLACARQYKPHVRRVQTSPLRLPFPPPFFEHVALECARVNPEHEPNTDFDPGVPAHRSLYGNMLLSPSLRQYRWQWTIERALAPRTPIGQLLALRTSLGQDLFNINRRGLRC